MKIRDDTSTPRKSITHCSRRWRKMPVCAAVIFASYTVCGRDSRFTPSSVTPATAAARKVRSRFCNGSVTTCTTENPVAKMRPKSSSVILPEQIRTSFSFSCNRNWKHARACSISISIFHVPCRRSGQARARCHRSYRRKIACRSAGAVCSVAQKTKGAALSRSSHQTRQHRRGERAFDSTTIVRPRFHATRTRWVATIGGRWNFRNQHSQCCKTFSNPSHRSLRPAVGSGWRSRLRHVGRAVWTRDRVCVKSKTIEQADRESSRDRNG